ncbi:MAG: Flp family type IVb pilin [Litorimonas sp.]
MTLIRKLLCDQSGATAVEYAMLLALFSVALSAMWQRMGQNVQVPMNIASDTMDNAVDYGVDRDLTVRGGD